MKLGSEIFWRMKDLNGFVPNVAKCFVLINQHAFIAGINGIKKQPNKSLHWIFVRWAP